MVFYSQTHTFWGMLTGDADCNNGLWITAGGGIRLISPLLHFQYLLWEEGTTPKRFFMILGKNMPPLSLSFALPVTADCVIKIVAACMINRLYVINLLHLEIVNNHRCRLYVEIGSTNNKRRCLGVGFQIFLVWKCFWHFKLKLILFFYGTGVWAHLGQSLRGRLVPGPGIPKNCPSAITFPEMWRTILCRIHA